MDVGRWTFVRSVFGRVAVVMGLDDVLHGDEMKVAMPHTAQGDDGLGERPHGLHRPSQKDGLQAVIVVQLCVHGGQAEVMMGVVAFGQAGGQGEFMMIVDVAQRGHALASLFRV